VCPLRERSACIGPNLPRAENTRRRSASLFRRPTRSSSGKRDQGPQAPRGPHSCVRSRVSCRQQAQRAVPDHTCKAMNQFTIKLDDWLPEP
jgi:hypothetical protein